MVSQPDNVPGVKLRATKLRNRRLLKITQPKIPHYEREETDIL